MLGQFHIPLTAVRHLSVTQMQVSEAKDYQSSSQLDSPHASTGCFEHTAMP